MNKQITELTSIVNSLTGIIDCISLLMKNIPVKQNIIIVDLTKPQEIKDEDGNIIITKGVAPLVRFL